MLLIWETSIKSECPIPARVRIIRVKSASFAREPSSSPRRPPGSEMRPPAGERIARDGAGLIAPFDSSVGSDAELLVGPAHEPVGPARFVAVVSSRDRIAAPGHANHRAGVGQRESPAHKARASLTTGGLSLSVFSGS